MDELYIKLEWPEYQFYMHRPDAFYCPEIDCYFIPKTIFDNIEVDEEAKELLNIDML